MPRSGSAAPSPAPDVPSAGSDWIRLLQTVSLALTAGLLCSFVGAILARLAMRLLVLTSPQEVRGTLSDDNEIIGRFTLGGTAALVLFLTGAGTIAGAGYLLARRGLPRSRQGKVACWAGMGMTFGSLLAIRDGHSVDYSALGPRWLSVPLFIGLPALTAGASAYLIEVWDESGGWFHSRKTWLTLLPGALALAIFYLVAIPIIGVGLLVAFVVRRLPALYKAWSSRVVTLMARVAVSAIILLGATNLLVDVQSMVVV